MATTEVVVQGAVTPEGQLVLDEQPDVPPGRVEVVVRPIVDATPGPGTLLEVLKPIWAELDAQGARGRSPEEAVADVRALREEWGAHDRRLEEFREECRARGPQDKGGQS